jgi:transposase
MAKALSLTLTQEQEQQLASFRDRHPKPYVRERAAALLQVAAGASARSVAADGLFKPRDHETVADWVRRYAEQGLAGLLIKAGRGRKPAFSPAPARC